MQKVLFRTKYEGLEILGRKFREVEFSDLEVFQEFTRRRDKIVQFASSGYFIHYWNMGNYKLFINSDFRETDELIPIARKYKSTPSYFIVAPIVHDVSTIVEICRELQTISKNPVRVRYMIESESNLFAGHENFNVRRHGDKEYINELEPQLLLEGHKFKRVRQAIRNGQRKNPEIKFKLMEPSDVSRVNQFLDEWLRLRADSYFRPSVGNSKRRAETFCRDMGHTFILLALDGDKVASIYMEAIEPGTNFAVCPLAKTLPQYTDLSYWTFHEAKKIAFERGARFENIGMSSSPGGKAYKMRWNPVDTFIFYEAIYLGDTNEI